MSKCMNTYENHPDYKMQTHWYQANYAQVRDAIVDITRDLQMNIGNIDDNYKELLVVNKKYKLMLKVTEYKINETSIDLYLEVLGMFDFSGKKFIDLWHECLGRKLPFLGVGLHP